MSPLAIPNPPHLFVRTNSSSEESRGSEYLLVDWDNTDLEGIISWDIRIINCKVNTQEIIYKASKGLMITGLSSNTLYKLSVRGRSEHEISEFSDDLEVYTRPLTPSSPVLLETNEYPRTTCQFSLSWSRDLPDYRYEICITEVSLFTDVNPPFTFRDLLPNHIYAIKIRCYSSHPLNYSFWSEELIVATRPLKPSPPQLAYPQLGSFSMQVQWDASYQDRGYIELQITDGEREILRVTDLPLKGSQYIHNQEPNAFRSVRLRVLAPISNRLCYQNVSDWSDALIIPPDPHLVMRQALMTSVNNGRLHRMKSRWYRGKS